MRKTILIVAAVSILLVVTLGRNYFNAHARGRFMSCRHNQLNLATAIEKYAADNQGQLPVGLSGLVPKYLPKRLQCPRDPAKEYVYRAENSNYRISCLADHGNWLWYKDTVNYAPGFPQYDSEKGLLNVPADLAKERPAANQSNQE